MKEVKIKLLVFVVCFYANLNFAHSSSNYCLQTSVDKGILYCPFNASLLIKNAITVELWMNADELSEWCTPISCLQDNLDNESGFCFTYAFNKMRFLLKTESGYANKWNTNPGVSITPGNWYHLAGVYDGREVRMYCNGQLIETQQYSGQIVWKYKPIGLVLGAFYDQNDHIGFKGKLDEIRIWNYARTSEQLNQCINTPLTGKESGLVVYYNFDDKDFEKVTDLSPNKNHALPHNNGNLKYVNSSAMIQPVITGYTLKANNSVELHWECVHDHLKPKRYLIDLAYDPDFQVRLPDYKNLKVTESNSMELKNLETRSKYYVRVKGVFNDNEITAFSRTMEINDLGYDLNVDLIYNTDSLVTIPIFDRLGASSKTIHLTNGNHSFRLDFSVLNINPNLKFKFRYKLKGFDTDWFYPEEGKYTTHYPHLPSGGYTILIEVSDGNATFKGNIHEIGLKIESSPLRVFIILLLLAVFSLLILFFTRTFQVKIIHKGKAEKQEHETEKLKEIKNYLETQKPYLDKNLTVQLLAEELNMSKADLSAIIRNQLNKNFNDFINSYRVEEVKRKLDNPEFSKYTVLTIAELCGFNSQSSFYRVFKNITGKTPNDYQNK